MLLNIKSTLEAITVANGYKTTVALVEPYNRSRDDVATGARPYLCFGIGAETPEQELSNYIKVTAPIYIIGLVTNGDWTQRSAALNNLIDDIITAMMADYTRGGYAISTLFTGCETDEGDPDAGADGGVCVATFTISYERLTTAS
jgi:hypothetical protein